MQQQQRKLRSHSKQPLHRMTATSKSYKQKIPYNKVISSLQRHKEANLDKNKPKKGKYSSKPKLKYCKA